MLTWIEQNELNEKHPYARYRDAHVPTEFGTLKSEDGQTLYYSLRKPLNFEAGKRYPVFLAVYGGPGAQTVERKWNSLFDQYMAQQGYVVFRLDNRGSARRERQFTDAIYGELGRHEVSDQVAGIDWLARQSFVDGQTDRRIRLELWRLHEPAPAVSPRPTRSPPACRWRRSPTGRCTTPITPSNSSAIRKRMYRATQQSNVFAHLDGLRSPLLLVHGMADDNVLFTQFHAADRCADQTRHPV